MTPIPPDAPPCLHEFVKVARWPTAKNLRYRCRVCGMTTRAYDGVDQMSMRPIHRRMSVAFPGMNVVDRHGVAPTCRHDVVQVPTVDGGRVGICLRCGERGDPS